MRIASVKNEPLLGALRCAIAAGLALFVTYSVLHAGLPALRHDWRVPLPSDAQGPWLESLWEGWVPNGIGSVQPYPTFYLSGFALWLLHPAVSSYGDMVLVLAGTVYLASTSAARIVANNRGSVPAQIAAAVFVALNPWVYAKYVAGHMFMVFAYAVLLAIVAETTRAEPRRWSLLILAALVVTQIEFFLVACVPLLVWSCRRRSLSVVATICLAASPLVLGIVAAYSTIRVIPFNLAWQNGQSVAPLSALALNGYEFDYARAFGPFWLVGAGFAAAALIGLRGALRTTLGRLAFGVGLGAFLLASGTKGPLAEPYRFAVLHFPPIGVFRELYDLIAFVAIAYVILISFGFGGTRTGGSILAVLALVWLVPWIRVPPSSFFIVAAGLPRAADPPGPSERVAYLPAFQPFTFNGRGSGVDPDAYVRRDRALPLNEFYPTFPVDAALSRLERADERYAAALGVAAVVNRPCLASDDALLRFQRLGRAMERYASAGRSRVLNAAPLLALTTAPRETTLGFAPDENAVFFGDRHPALIGRFAPSIRTTDPAFAWVDARLAMSLHPEIANAFGGVTTIGTEPLQLPPGRWGSLLAQTDGVLRDGTGTIVAGPGKSLRWWPLPANARALVCGGSCTVVLTGNVPQALPADAPAEPARAVGVHFASPWFAHAALPESSAAALRLNVRYDDAWIALAGGKLLTHERLDTALNVWTLPKVPAVRDVYFVEIVAAAQFALELIAAAMLVGLLSREAFRAHRRHARRPSAP